MKKLNESLPQMIPTYPVKVAGQELTLRFDTNINKTKKGVKLQFVLENVPEDPRELQKLTNEIGAELQKRFGEAGLQIMYDVENPYKNVIGFLIPLTSMASFVIKDVIKKEAGTVASPSSEEEAPEEELPEEPIAERRKIKFLDLL